MENHKKIINEGNSALGRVIKQGLISKEDAILLTKLVDNYQKVLKNPTKKPAKKSE